MLSLIYYSIATLIIQCNGDDFLDRAKEILEEVPLIDGHNDLAWSMIRNSDGVMDAIDLEQDTCDQYWIPDTACHTDIPRLREGMVGGQFWAVYTRCNNQHKNGVQRAVQIIDYLRRIFDEYDYFFQYATSADDIEAAKADGKLASLLGLEGGHMIGENLGVLRMFYELGVRYMTLTWNCNLGWADQNYPDSDTNIMDPVGGLSEWGKQLIVEMNRMGMLVDLSHVSFDTMHDTLDVALAPVIFSHSSVYSICPHRRNVPDDVLLRVPQNGGLVMINFSNKFLNCTEDNAYEPGYRPADVDLIVEHMEYVRDMIGVDYVGFGADYDGISYSPEGAEDTSGFPNVVAAMLRRGWEEEDVAKVVGYNLLRVLRAAEGVRDSMAGVAADDTPYADGIPDDSCQPPFDDRYP